MKLPSLIGAVLDVIVVLFLFMASGILMSALLFLAIITESTLRLIQAYTLRPYHYLHFKLGVLRGAR
jgi:hypothetical protein